VAESKDPFEIAFQKGEVENDDARRAADAERSDVKGVIETAFTNLEQVVRTAVGDSTAFGTLAASEAEFPEERRHRYELRLAGSGQRMELRITGSAAIVHGGPGVGPFVACDELNVQVETVRDPSVANVGRGYDQGIVDWFSTHDGKVAISVDSMREMIRSSVEQASKNTS
jgi:hypothetical protein